MGTRARWGVVAVPQGSGLFGRTLYIVHGVRYGGDGAKRWYFRAEDHIGWGSPLDFFVPWGGEPDCAWGRRTVAYRVLIHR